MTANWKCPHCHNTTTDKVLDTIETIVDNETLVVDNIPAKQCTQCKEIFHDMQAGKYIDSQVLSFKVLKTLRIVKKDNKYHIRKAE